VNWIRAAPEHGSTHGNWWNAKVWSECRQMAARFFADVGQQYNGAARAARELSAAPIGMWTAALAQPTSRPSSSSCGRAWTAAPPSVFGVSKTWTELCGNWGNGTSPCPTPGAPAASPARPPALPVQGILRTWQEAPSPIAMKSKTRSREPRLFSSTD
jgi:hypothetical protein